MYLKTAGGKIEFPVEALEAKVDLRRQPKNGKKEFNRRIVYVRKLPGKLPKCLLRCPVL
jgi:hypothetical protein